MEPLARTTTDADKITTVLLDVPGKPVNTIGPDMLAQLNAILTTIEQDRPAGVVFASAKKSFIAGADLAAISQMNREQVLQFMADGQALFSRIAKLSMPTVAAINGDALGGGLELALACTYRVASDLGSTKIGLPEVNLGIIPGWGGTVRLPRLIGLAKALPLMLAGKQLPPRKAKSAGIVNEVVRPESLPSAAKRWALSNEAKPHPKALQRALAATSMGRKRIFTAAQTEVTERTFGNYPAPLRLIEVVRTGYDKGEDAGFEAERKGLTDLMDTDACKNSMRLFFLRSQSKKWTSAAVQAKPNPVTRAAVIGGGTMGAGIVHSLVRAGIEVRLIEVNPQAVSAALVRVQKMLDDEVGAGKMSKLEARHAMNRVSPATDWTGLGLVDFTIEAVLEEMPIKRDVFNKLDELAPDNAVLATNTSSLNITDIADSTKNPARVVGLHFFNPVPKMPLVEVIRTSKSDDQSLANALGLAAKLGKIAVLVQDAPGFLVNRILVPYLAEAVVMAGEGISITEIDRAAKQWGMPMGPFELIDEIGLDISQHVLKSLADAFENLPLPRGLEVGIDKKWLGKKTRIGFYKYEKKVKGLRKRPKPEVNQEFIQLLTSSAVQVALPDDQIQFRLILPMVNEAARVLSEGVTDNPDAIDLATVMGLGLAPFRGGLIRFADSVGTEKLVNQLDELTSRYGPRFAPAELLRQLAEAHLPFEKFAEIRQPATTT